MTEHSNPHSASTFYESVLGNVKTMTSYEESLVLLGVCPVCRLSFDDSAVIMGKAGDSVGLRSYQCVRCNHVWLSRMLPEGRSSALEGERLSRLISEYLQVGGLFNPEMMEHDKVRDLLMDCRKYIDSVK